MAIKKKSGLRINSKYNRNFSKDFRKQKVKDIEKGILNIKQLCELYSISRTTVYNWIYLYSKIEKGVKTVVQMESEEYKTKKLLHKIAELERVVGQKQLEIDYLEQVIHLSSDEVGYDLKKKHAPQS